MDDDAEKDDAEHHTVGDQGAIGGVDDVIGDPQACIDKGPQAIRFAVFLADGTDVDEARDHGQDVRGTGEHQNIRRSKGDGVHGDQPRRQGSALTLEEVIDDRLRGTDQAGDTSVQRTRQDITDADGGVGREQEKEDQLHIFALEQLRNAGADRA